MTNKELKFYDLKARKTFSTDCYEIREKSGRRFAVAQTESGGEAWRILPPEHK